MKRLIIPFFLVVLGCSEHDPSGIDPRLVPFIESFADEGMKRGKRITYNHLSAKLGSLQSFGLQDGPSIIINEAFFASHLSTRADSNFVKLVVWHELGHWKGQNHRGGVSVMNCGDWFMNCGDFVGTVQKYNASEAAATEITDELFSYVLF